MGLRSVFFAACAAMLAAAVPASADEARVSPEQRAAFAEWLKRSLA